MSKIWPKVIRDPVHNIIPFENNKWDPLLLDLINTKEFQRLRRIKQLGMSELTFPGANHSRFAHSIGVMHIARKMLAQIERERSKLSEDQYLIVTVAALLHDVGHGPFSHAFEKITKESHETRTLEIICDDTTEIHQKLIAVDKDLPKKLRVFFDEDIEDTLKNGTDISPILTQIVSSQLDADRADYLLRDSYSTGTDYGKFDLDWLLLQQKVDEKGKFFLSKKAAAAAEAYVFARYHMYQAVYFHKATRAAEVMLKLTFKRYKELLSQSSEKAKIVPDASGFIVKAFSDDKMSLNEYLSLDDYAVVEFLKSCEKSKDPLLVQLGGGIVHRKLYKGIDVTDASDNMEGFDRFLEKARAIAASTASGSEYSLISDTAADTPYKPYDPDAQKPATQIYLESSLGEIEEISKKRESLQNLRKKYSMVRYYFPESIRDQIDKVATENLKKGGT